MNVDPVQQRSGDFTEVTSNLVGRTLASAFGIGQITARAPMRDISTTERTNL